MGIKNSSILSLGLLSCFAVHGAQDFFDDIQKSMDEAWASVGRHDSMQTEDQGEKGKLIFTVPDVEDSEKIHPYRDKVQDFLKVIVPQRNAMTEIIIRADRCEVITKACNQEEKQEGKNHFYGMSQSQRSFMKTLPFLVDTRECTIDYKDDILVIMLNKAPENKTASAQKAQTRVIHFADK